MALNFTVSYTFSPGTTISSSQVNTNTTDVAAVFQGLEAETKTLAKLKVDIDPTIALEVATKQYVDHYSAYRRPVLVYNSGTVANMETGINGTSGQAQILFPDGNLRQDSTTARINCNLAQVAALSGTAQSGLRTGTVANNTWYAIYAVKTSDNSSNFVAVADTVLPLQANFATLNSNFVANSWVYLGLIRYGDQSGVANAILSFVQTGNMTRFTNLAGGSTFSNVGVYFGNGTATSVTFSTTRGTSGLATPNNINIVEWSWGVAAGSGSTQVSNSAATISYTQFSGTLKWYTRLFSTYADGINLSNGSAVVCELWLSTFIDNVLGVGSNPIL